MIELQFEKIEMESLSMLPIAETRAVGSLVIEFPRTDYCLSVKEYI